jgi:hypothetical protein
LVCSTARVADSTRGVLTEVASGDGADAGEVTDSVVSEEEEEESGEGANVDSAGGGASSGSGLTSYDTY